jgi:hypothetical protein
LKPEKILRHVITSLRTIVEMMRVYSRPPFAKLAGLIHVLQTETRDSLRVADSLAGFGVGSQCT